MGYCSEVLRFASPSTTFAKNQGIACKDNERPEQNSRLVTMLATPPRTSRVAGYSSKTPSLGQRLCAWLKTGYIALNSARLEFAYKNACQNSLIALNLALSGGHGHFSRAQLLNFAKCRGRQYMYKSRDAGSATKLDDTYLASLIDFCKARKKDLKKLSEAMSLPLIKDARTPESQKIRQAKTLCTVLNNLTLAPNPNLGNVSWQADPRANIRLSPPPPPAPSLPSTPAPVPPAASHR